MELTTSLNDLRGHLSPLFRYKSAEQAFKELGELRPQIKEELDKRVAKAIAKGYIHRKPQSAFWEALMLIKWNMVYADLDNLFISTGPEGVGKSNLDLVVGILVDETFEPETLKNRILYTSTDIHDFLDNEPQYSFALVDEGGSLFSSRDFNSPESRSMIRLLMTAREDVNRMIAVNVPYFGRLDTFLRNDRLRFVVQGKFVFHPKYLTLQKGIFNAYTAESSQAIKLDTSGKLRFPRPDITGYCPGVGGNLWRAYKAISGPKKKELREREREKLLNGYGRDSQ